MDNETNNTSRPRVFKSILQPSQIIAIFLLITILYCDMMIWNMVLMGILTSSRFRNAIDVLLNRVETVLLYSILLLKPAIKMGCGYLWKYKTAIVLLILTFQVNFMLIKTLAEEIHVPMPMVCDKPIASQYLNHKNCWESCDLEGLNPTPHNITIYQQTVDVPISVIECRLFRTKVRYTKTWTFSKFKTVFPDERLSPNDKMCWDFVKKHCKAGSKCESTRPEIEENYVYAADNDKVIEWAKVNYHTVDAPISIGSELNIRLEGNLVLYKTGRYTSTLDEKMSYLWDPNAEIKCTSHPIFHTQCNAIDSPSGGVQKYMCGRGNLVISPHHELDVSACILQSGVWVSKEGLIYDTRTAGKYIKDSLPMYSGLSPETIRTVVLQSRVRRLIEEEELCKSNCLNFRLDNDEDLSLYGKRPMYRVKSDQVRECKEDYFCKVSEPVRVCKGSNLMNILCGNHEMWWNVSSTVVLPDETCRESAVVEHSKSIIIFKPGGFFKINESGAYHIAGKEIHRQFKIHSLDKGIMIIDSEKVRGALYTTDGLVKHEKVESNDTITKNTWEFGITDFLEEIEHNTKVAFVCVLLTIVSCFVLYAMFIRNKGYKGYESTSMEMVNY